MTFIEGKFSEKIFLVLSAPPGVDFSPRKLKLLTICLEKVKIGDDKVTKRKRFMSRNAILVILASSKKLQTPSH